jgi:enoyl-CoA hydratase
MNTPETVEIEKRNGVGFIIFDRPQFLNIISSAVLKRLGDALADMEKDGSVRAMVIAGKRHFSAGADIRELKEKNAEQAQAFARLGQRVCNFIEEMRKPVIAAVSGYALGAGCEIALSCDIRIASESARFAQPEVNLGIVPGFGGTQRLATLVGFGRAKELVLSGRMVEAVEAAAIGLVSKVVAEAELMHAAEEAALALSEKSGVSLGLAKALVNQSRNIRDGLEAEVASFVECFEEGDHREGISAFLEKRKPVFKDR